MVKYISDENIVLIGFMATGKTTIGKELSNTLDRKLIDTDKRIEEKAGMTIGEIFEKHGEKHFRALENQVIKEVSGLEKLIISCGGGVALDPENIKNLGQKGKIVLLEADPKTIRNRIKNNKNRPLLNEKNSIENIKKIMDQRKDLYLQAADIIIDTRTKSILAIRDEILEEL